MKFISYYFMRKNSFSLEEGEEKEEAVVPPLPLY